MAFGNTYSLRPVIAGRMLLHAMTTFDAPVLGRLLAPIDDAEALQVVLDGWRLWREPRLARLVDVLSNRLVLARGTIPGLSHRDRTAQPAGFRRRVSATPRNSADCSRHWVVLRQRLLTRIFCCSPAGPTTPD